MTIQELSNNKKKKKGTKKKKKGKMGYKWFYLAMRHKK